MKRATFLTLIVLLCASSHNACADLRIDEHALLIKATSAAFAAIGDPFEQAMVLPQHRLTMDALILPTQGRLTSFFGMRADPLYGAAAFHEGIDIAEHLGAIVRAAAAGRVARAGPMGGCGTGVEIDHGKGFATRYCHLGGLFVRRGARVVAGETIGHIGVSGRTTGPHLHFEVRVHGRPVDPVEHLYF
ncbi:MAG: M23 family metallopeptidase [bacterium]